ncbi:MAG: hypothetical protein F2545_05435 [Actinobacteria bacterium]|uniref:Unannotated protein n=1 Tax=freshwater metagenome TaxID=449393 RepID=A0A6J6DID1_9ZZZZ|nr:hypothetical protein [Actinomycetota bacterium]
MEDRVRDLELMSQVRTVRQAAIEESRAGRLASVFSRSEGDERFIYVVKLLDVHPQLGKVAGRKLLASLGVSSFDCVGDLSPELMERILKSVGES